MWNFPSDAREDDLAVLLARVFLGVTWRPSLRTRPSRSCSCQLSNKTIKMVDGPHRGCTYGPWGLCRSHRDYRNNDYNINKQNDGSKRGRFRPVFSPGLVILRRETPKDPVTLCSAGSSATPSPKGSALKKQRSKLPSGGRLRSSRTPNLSIFNSFTTPSPFLFSHFFINSKWGQKHWPLTLAFLLFNFCTTACIVKALN